MIDKIQQNGIVIIDYGSQYTQLIARRIRELNVYSVILPHSVTEAILISYNPKGIILSGGPRSVYENNAPQISDFIFALDLPILGICYGMQAMVYKFNGHVSSSARSEYGEALLEVIEETLLFPKKQFTVWMSHGDSVVDLPQRFFVLAKTQDTPIAAIAHENNKWFGMQFHPEVMHTECGSLILANFIFKICGAEPSWTTSDFIKKSLIDIKSLVKDSEVLLGLSGGVDSSTLALLLNQVLGNKLLPVFVDTGLLRKNEVLEVNNLFSTLGIKIYTINASERFIKALSGVVCPEKKRKIIGKLFIKVFKEFALSHKNCKWLAQGTIYPDVIESSGDGQHLTSMIKSHHNVGGLPKKLGFKLLEPFRQLFKDEVRNVAKHLKMPDHMINRHPFPGPGLAVRIAGVVSQERVKILQKVDEIFINVLKNHDWYNKISQAFAVYVPIKSVSVKGDVRKYEPIICLRAVVTQDFMTAEVSCIPYKILMEASSRITNEVDGISRVLYDISNKPPATIEWE